MKYEGISIKKQPNFNREEDLIVTPAWDDRIKKKSELIKANIDVDIYIYWLLQILSQNRFYKTSSREKNKLKN